MSGPYLLAIDAGTGSCRAVLFTETGAQAGAGQREWTHREPPGVPGGQDFDVPAGWRAIAACVRDALQAAGAAGADVAAVAATSTGWLARTCPSLTRRRARSRARRSAGTRSSR